MIFIHDKQAFTIKVNETALIARVYDSKNHLVCSLKKSGDKWVFFTGVGSISRIAIAELSRR